jgi:hypothetical protein
MPSQITDIEIEQLVKPIGITAYNVSAKTGEGVEKMFY